MTHRERILAAVAHKHGAKVLMDNTWASPLYFKALEKGVVDGVAFPTVGVVDMKWNEVAKYYLLPSFGISTLQIFMNASAFNRLSADDKAALLEVGKRMEQKIWDDYDKMAVEEIELMQKSGMREARLSKENEAQMGKLFAEGVWELALGKNGAEAQEFRKLVNEKGMGL